MASLLHANLAIVLSGENGEISDGEDSGEPSTNSLVVVLAHQPTKKGNVEDTKELRSRDLADEISKVVDDIGKELIIGVNTTKERLIQRRQNDHQNMLKAIQEHMCEHYQSTIYFMYETNRIATRGVVVDALREMTEHLDHNPDIKEEVIQCANVVIRPRNELFWNLPNELRIETVMDHINDGVWNK